MEKKKYTIHKKGEVGLFPIKYNFKYKVKTKYGFEKPLARQDIYYEDDILVVTYDDKRVLKMSKDHYHDVLTGNGNNVRIKATELEVGMCSESTTGIIRIVSIAKEPYKGILHDFTMPNDTFYANEIVTRNCRLRLDLSEIIKRSGGLFGSGDETGSMGVVTLNMPKIGYLSKDEDEFFERLTALMDIAKKSLQVKRKIVNQLFEQGFFPYIKRYLPSYANHFNTIGVLGMNECCLNFKPVGKDIGTPEGQAFTIKVLKFMQNKTSQFQVEDSPVLYNLESTPAESTSYRFALHDKKKFPDIITAGTIAKPYYTNSSNLPVGYTDDPWVAIRLQEQLQSCYTGGTVQHCYINEAVGDWRKVKAFIENVIRNSTLPYVTFSTTFGVCQKHGYLKGDPNGVCPFCKEEALAANEKKIRELEIKKAELEAELGQLCGSCSVNYETNN